MNLPKNDPRPLPAAFSEDLEREHLGVYFQQHAPEAVGEVDCFSFFKRLDELGQSILADIAAVRSVSRRCSGVVVISTPSKPSETMSAAGCPG